MVLQETIEQLILQTAVMKSYGGQRFRCQNQNNNSI